jgi:hypothetical protein
VQERTARELHVTRRNIAVHRCNSSYVDRNLSNLKFPKLVVGLFYVGSSMQCLCISYLINLRNIRGLNCVLAGPTFRIFYCFINLSHIPSVVACPTPFRNFRRDVPVVFYIFFSVAYKK